ncbi:MAG: FAD-dependent monooxygenase, partial [Pseudaminobacter sp.]|nr:FAD-dependent monooxygenase [Pseudaminobacter sp.]
MHTTKHIIIAGAGIAGLTAALAFARRGFSATIFERAAQLQEVGAGLQLSPNATRILEKLGVLPGLLPAAVRPEAVILRDAGTLAELARVPLGSDAEKKWKAPYLVAHRADLQRALLARVAGES